MRTKTLVLTAALSAAGLASSMAQVYSVNIVGYVNKVAPASGYIMVNTPLNSPTNTLNSLWATAPSGAQFLQFSGGGFVTSTKIPTGWTVNSQIPVGKGGFFRNPTATPFTNTFVGDVVTGLTTNQYPSGYSIIASTSPLDSDVNAAGLTPNLVSGDQVLTFNPATQNYTTKTLLNPATGVWSGPTPTFVVGESFFLRAANAGSWVRNFNP